MRTRPAGAAALAIVALSFSACRDATATAPDAALRPLVAAERQCAPLIAGGWPIDLGAEALATPAVDALVAAGLIRRDVRSADPAARPQTVIAIAPGGRAWIDVRRLNAGGNEIPFLCYGKRALVDAQATGDVARYRFRVVDAAPWTARADIQAAFPFLKTALAGPITAEQPAQRRDGAWHLPENSAWLPGATLQGKGFYPCRPDDPDKPCG